MCIQVQNNFALLLNNRKDEKIQVQFRQVIFEIMKLNMDAIKQKSDVAKQTVETVNLWIAIVAKSLFSDCL